MFLILRNCWRCAISKILNLSLCSMSFRVSFVVIFNVHLCFCEIFLNVRLAFSFLYKVVIKLCCSNTLTWLFIVVGLKFSFLADFRVLKSNIVELEYRALTKKWNEREFIQPPSIASCIIFSDDCKVLNAKTLRLSQGLLFVG